MEIADINWSVLAPLVGGNTPMPIIRVRDTAMGEAIRAKATDFWQRVNALAPPAPDFTKDGAAIAAVYRDNDGSSVDLSDNERLAVLCRQYKKASADEKTSQGGEVVYFVLSGDNRIKIGTSANVEKRLEALQTSSATRLSLLLTVPGGVDMETELHRRFRTIRESGEWFKGTPELRSFIEGALFYKSRSVM